jgi:hypothetical protein
MNTTLDAARVMVILGLEDGNIACSVEVGYGLPFG